MTLFLTKSCNFIFYRRAISWSLRICKTTLTLHAIAEAQKLGGTCAFVDAEHALDPVYAKKLGVKTEELLISQPDNGEQALDIH